MSHRISHFVFACRAFHNFLRETSPKYAPYDCFDAEYEVTGIITPGFRVDQFRNLRRECTGTAGNVAEETMDERDGSVARQIQYVSTCKITFYVTNFEVHKLRCPMCYVKLQCPCQKLKTSLNCIYYIVSSSVMMFLPFSVKMSVKCIEITLHFLYGNHFISFK